LEAQPGVGDWPERGMVVDEFGRISVIAQTSKTLSATA